MKWDWYLLKETETHGHVLRSCAKGELLITSRHHKVRSSIAAFLKSLGFKIYEEIQTNG